MSKAIKDILKQNNLPTSPIVPESPEEKAERERKEKEAGGGGESAEAKIEREKKAAELLRQQQETPEAKAERERKEKEAEEKRQQQQGPSEIDDAMLIAALNKRGKKITSLDELNAPVIEPTPEEKIKIENEKRDKIRAYGLHNKKVTSTELDNYARDTNIPYKDLAFNLYRQERIKELTDAKTPADQMPDDKALREEFNETHYQYAEENDPKRKHSEKLMKKNVDDYLENTYSKVLDLEEDYESHQNESSLRKTYNETVNEVVKGLGEEMDFEIIIDKDKNEKFPFKFKITPDVANTITQAYLNDASFNSLGKGKINKELLQEAIKGSLIQREYARIMSEGALAYASKMLEDGQKGRRGIPPSRKDEGSEGGEKRENKVVKAVLNQPDNKKILQPN